MYAWSTQETLKLHTCTLTCITYATYITYTSMLQACQRHAVCILHACMPHSYYCMHAIVIHTAHNYSAYMHYYACMHTIPTSSCYLLLHVNFMQNPCKHFPWMHKLMLHSHNNAALTQAICMHTSHKHIAPTHHAACKPHLCKFTVCIQDVFMCMAIFMHGACACSTTCMWHACSRDANVQCMCMHVGGMHACSVRHARVCGVHSCGT